MVKLRRVYEYKCFESQKDLDDLKDHLGDDLYNDYMKIRDRIPKDQNDYKDFQKLKKLPTEDVKDFVDNFQSETDKRKEAKKGAKKLYEDSDWIVYKITTYPASVYYGSNTKWCITGRYPNHEKSGEEYFNDYINKNEIFFYINKHNDKEKYAVLKNKRTNLISDVYNSADYNLGKSADFINIELPYVEEVGLNTKDQLKFFDAIKEGDLDIVKKFFNKEYVNTKDSKGNTPLILAVLRSYDDIAEFLLRNHANVNAVNGTDNTPLIYACSKNNLKLVKLLVKYGADVNAINMLGETPLSSTENKEIKEFLYKNGAIK